MSYTLAARTCDEDDEILPIGDDLKLSKKSGVERWRMLLMATCGDSEDDLQPRADSRRILRDDRLEGTRRGVIRGVPF